MSESYAVGFGFPEGVDLPSGRVTACGDGLHVVRGVQAEGGARACECRAFSLSSRVALSGVARDVDVLVPDAFVESIRRGLKR